MQRYFVETINLDKRIAVISGDDYYHITKVMRMKLGDEVIICASNEAYFCEIISINSEEVKLSIKEKLESRELSCQIHIACGMVRKEKLEEIIDRLSELGSASFMPIFMEYCNIKISKDDFLKKMERYQKIAKEACEQSQRNKIMEICDPLTIDELIKNKDKYSACYFAYEKASLDDHLLKVLDKDSLDNILILTGPEGGFSEKEVEKLLKNGFKMLSLGKRILRCEVAPTFIMSLINGMLEE